MIPHSRSLRRRSGFPVLAAIAVLLSACGGPPTEADVKQAIDAKADNIQCETTADKDGGYLCTFLTGNVEDTAQLKYESGAWHAYNRFNGGSYAHNVHDTPENRDKVTKAMRTIFGGISQASVTPMDYCHFDVGLPKGHRIFNLTYFNGIDDGRGLTGSQPLAIGMIGASLHCSASGDDCSNTFSITNVDQSDVDAARLAGTVIMSVCNPAARR